MRKLKTGYIRFLKICWILFSIPFLYLGAAFILTLVPSNASFKETEQGIEVFIKSNGVHTDIVVPVVTAELDWKKKVHPHHFQKSQNHFQYISFGWGDKDFFMHTPTWSDLRFITAFNALFWLGSGAMRVTYYEVKPQTNKYTSSLLLTTQQHAKLITYIQESFKVDEAGNYKVLDCCDYSNINDKFFEAKGTYSLFNTCNNWTNQGLKQCGVKTALWAPFEWGIMYYRRE